MTRQPTQRERVLAALKRTGRRGVTSIDFLGPRTIDGLPPILRLGARVDDLRRAGVPIVASMERIGRARVARYRLARPASPAPPAPRPAAVATTALQLDLGAAVARRPASPFDPYQEVA